MRLSPRSLTLLTALLSVCVSTPALAQTKDQLHQRTQLDSMQAALPLVQQMGAAITRQCQTKNPASYVKAVCSYPVVANRLLGKAMKGETSFVALYITPKDTQVVVAPPPAPDSSVAQTGTPAPSAPPPAPAPSSAFAVPAGLGLNLATVAELPRDTAPTPYPAIARQVRVSLIANLQSALNAAQPGDELLLPAGAAYTGDFLLPKHAGAGVASCSSWIVVRTDIPDSLLGAPGVRMTPTRAAALKLARIQTPDGQQAIGSAWGVANVGCWRLVGLEILPQPGNANATDVNGLVRFGDHTVTDSTKLAHHLVLDRSYVHGSATPSPLNAPLLPGQVKRCAILNSRWNVIVDSWLEYCRGGNGDPQAVLSYIGGPIRLSNNHLSGGAEVVMFGGQTPALVGAVTSDVTVHGNLITRELADTLTLVKNLVESKNVDRLDVAGNVLRLNWKGAQEGYAILVKSVNQSNTGCTWCHSINVTVRYNRIAQSLNGWNLAGIMEGPALPAGPYTFYHNVTDSLGFRDKDGSGGRAVQVLGASSLYDVTLAFNTVTPTSWGLMSEDGGPAARVAIQSNAFWCGGYGVKGNSTGIGTASLAAFLQPYAWANNALFGCSSGYPNGTTYSSSLAAAIAAGTGAQLGTLLDRVDVPR